MNILLVINESYIEQLIVLLKSLSKSNPKTKFNVFILYRLLPNNIKSIIGKNINNKQFNINMLKIDNEEINNFPAYQKRYPVEIYFRLFATKYLPKNIDRILYLDTDIVVINKLDNLYNMDFEDNYYVATTNIRKALYTFHKVRLGLKKNSVYVNTGVLLMNLEELRKEPICEKVCLFVQKYGYKLMLPDQDILTYLYGDKVKIIESNKYNLGERGYKLYNIRNKNNKIDLDWVKSNTVIIHYYGKNKPWNDNYKGELNCFYNELL